MYLDEQVTRVVNDMCGIRSEREGEKGEKILEEGYEGTA